MFSPIKWLRLICVCALAGQVFAQPAPLTITTSSLPNATLQSVYSATLTASGGFPSYRWTIVGSLPPGLTLDASSGTISGTPMGSPQTYSFTANVFDSQGQQARKPLSITVQAPPLVITNSSPLPDGTATVSYSYVMNASGGTAPYSGWGVSSGALPPGLSISSSTGQISGTPTTAAVYRFSIGVFDSAKTSATKAFSLTIQPPTLVITSSSPAPNGLVGANYSFNFAASGGVAPYSWSVSSGNLPGGLSLSPAGALTGKPTTAGAFTFTVHVNDSPPQTLAAQVATKSFTLTVQNSGLIINSSSPAPSGVVGQSYSFNFDASGGSPPYVWSLASGNLPAGLTLASNGSLTGTPTAVGVSTFTIRVTDSPLQGAAPLVVTKTFDLRITQPLSVTTPSPINATAGSALTVVMTATGGSPAYLWSVAQGSQLPPGFTLDASSGFLSGTPAAAGTFNFTVLATDSANNTATKGLVLSVQPALAITTDSSAPAGAAGVDYSVTLAATGGNTPYTWTLESGTLPPGLTLDPAKGVISGPPQSTGAFSFVIRVTDSAKATITKQFSLTINAATQNALISTANLDFTAPAGGDTPAPQGFAVITTAAQALQFSIQIDGGATGTPAPGWLSVRLLKGSTPARIPVAVDQTGLQPGKYSARILVNTTDGRQNIVTVTFTVTADAQQLDVSPGFLRFAGSVSALTAAEQSLLVRNSGGGGPLVFRVSISGDAAWLRVTPSSGQAGPNAAVSLRVLVNAQDLSPGALRGVIHLDSAAGNADIPVALLVRDNGPVIGFNISGLRFEARKGNGHSNTRNANVLNLGDGAVNWRAEIVSGAEWLSLGETSGSAIGATPSRLPLSANPGSLDVGLYYALIRVTDPGSLNSPQFFTAMLSIEDAGEVPEPDPSPSGLFFVGKTGASPPASQPIRVFVSSTTPISFQASANASDGGNWLAVSPANGTTSTQNTAQVAVSVNPVGLAPGVYSGDVTFAFSNTVIRTTNITLVLQPATAGSSSAKTREVAGCTPARLSLTQTGLVNSFAAPAGWPSSLIVRLADDCGDPVLNGQVVATFSNGDPAAVMSLTNPDIGLYSATWAPGKVANTVTVTARGSAPNLASATAEITGSVAANKVPVLTRNGTLNNLNPVIGAPLAPGTVAQVYGENLATARAEPGVVPLRTTFNGTRMLVGAFEAPLYFLSDGQLNVQIPNELQPGRDYPVVVEASGGYTLPDTLTVAPAQPGVLVFSDTRLIAQHGADPTRPLVTADSPARQDEPIILYLVGMGATNPSVASGVASPLDRLAPALAQPTVTIGGRPASIDFAGLTPGGVGLYQINLRVPAGLQAGDLPVVITQNGVVANTAVLPVR